MGCDSLCITKCSFFFQIYSFLDSLLMKTDTVQICPRWLTLAKCQHGQTKRGCHLSSAYYYNNFTPKMHNIKVQLNELLRRNSKSCWSEEYQTSFDELKRVLTSSLILKHYDPHLPINVTGDVLEHGVVAV